MKTLASVSQFFGKTFALWVLVFAALAFYFPATFKVFLPYVSILLGIVMFGMGLTLSVSDFKAVLTRPRDVIIGIVGQFVIMPCARSRNWHGDSLITARPQQFLAQSNRD